MQTVDPKGIQSVTQSVNREACEYPHTCLYSHTWISSRIKELSPATHVHSSEPRLLVEETPTISK